MFFSMTKLGDIKIIDFAYHMTDLNWLIKLVENWPVILIFYDTGFVVIERFMMTRLSCSRYSSSSVMSCISARGEMLLMIGSYLSVVCLCAFYVQY